MSNLDKFADRVFYVAMILAVVKIIIPGFWLILRNL